MSLDEAFAKYYSVFRGKVTKVEKGAGKSTVHFAVDTVWKGEQTKKVTLTTANSPAACGVQFAKNKEYVVWGWKGKSGMEATACSKTAPSDSAEEALAWLDQHHAPDDGDE